MRPIVCRLFVLSLWILPIWSWAENTPEAKKAKPPRPDVTVSRATSAIQVDGSLDEEAWEEAAVVPVLYEWTPGDNTPPPVKTECLVTYDEDSLYIAFRAHDPDPSAIRAHLMDRDSIDTFVQDDHVGVMIDTFNDERRAIQLRINPLGVQADASFSEVDGGEDWSWDTIWSAAGRITSDGYVVELAVPFHQMRFPRASGPQTWGFEAFRSWPRSVRHRMSSRYTDRDSGCILCQQGHLIGFEGIRPGLNVEVDPTLTYSPTATRQDFPHGKLEWQNSSPDENVLGISGRWGITSNGSLNATFNPDFSQVEADVAQLSVNTRFALFYPEKRPFFLEGSDFFNTPIQAVFTRTVADPKWGTKLTGKFGANAGGVFFARDELNNLILPSNQFSDLATLDESVTSSVARFRRDVGSGSTAGILYAGRESGDYHNRVFGADSFLRFSASDSLSLQFLHSDTAYPSSLADQYSQPEGSFGGNAVRANFYHSSEDWTLWANYEDRGRAFRADSGFVPRVDMRSGEVELQGILRRDNGWYTQLNYGAYVNVVTDQDGTLTDQALLPEFQYQGPMQSSFYFQGGQIKERFDDTLYTHWRQITQSSIQPTRSLRFTFFERFGQTVDYDNNRHARILQLNPTAELKLGRHVNLQLNHTYLRLDVTEGRLFTANLSQLRLVYQFSTRLLARAILQWTNIDRVPEHYLSPVDAKTQTLFSQFLVSYKLNPQTVVFLGYSDDRLGSDQIDLTQASRTLFLKVGYAWVL
jgi:uncharacterized protein DUF5916/cellulose/xylan binding protein with CBM9 domain